MDAHAMAAPALPTNFPCWVQAVYSWGGETKRDLGFIEGDLIECLNAGDGSWWTGRLKRDRRMVGLFPSNFVKVLDIPYMPVSQQSSSKSTPNASGVFSNTSSPASSGPSTPSPQKKSMFRKPFSSVASAAASPPGSVSKSSRFRPYSSMKNPGPSPSQRPAQQRAPSPSIPSPIARGSSPMVPRESSYISRTSSPLPQHAMYSSRPASPQPQYVSRCASPQPQYISRSPSPQPQFVSRCASPQPQYASRCVSPQPQFAQSRTAEEVDDDGDDGSPPPPPPPMHRVAYQHRSSSPAVGYEHNRHANGTHTPRAHTPANQHSGMTPSPLRDAINDVMTSLDDMGIRSQDEPPAEPESPPNIWSPEAFDEIYLASRKSIRSHTSQGFRAGEGHSRSHPDMNEAEVEQRSQLNNYVERMESRLRDLEQEDSTHEYFTRGEGAQFTATQFGGSVYGASSRPSSSHASDGPKLMRDASQQRKLNHRKSAFELGRRKLERTFTNKTSATSTSSGAQSTSTNNSNSTQLTSQSIMSGHSAGGFSATSAGSLARRKSIFGRSTPQLKSQPEDLITIQPTASPTVESAFAGGALRPTLGDRAESERSIASDGGGPLGGLSNPRPKKTGFFKKMVETAKTSAASARSTMSSGSSSRPVSRGRPASRFGEAVMSLSGGRSSPTKDVGRDMGLGGGSGNGTVDWVQMRRDVNRANSLSRNERVERAERCEMMDIPVVAPDRLLYESTDGDESADGYPVAHPTDFASASNMALVDKSARFLRDLPVTTNAISLAQGYLCRQFRSDVQKLRAIFTWVGERITVEEADDGFTDGHVDTRRVIQTRRGTSIEIATLVTDMCRAIGIHAEVVCGYVKTPGEALARCDYGNLVNRPNHAWSAVVCDGEWRIIDCVLASPTNCRRAAYSTLAGRDKADDWWFLARPMEICWTHVPANEESVHLSPPVSHDVLLSLPVACPAFFRHGLNLWDFDTSLLHLDGLEISHVQLTAPDDVEIFAEVETRAFQKDGDGDYFESGEMVKKRALAQAEFISTQNPDGSKTTLKRYTVKALLPPSDCQGTLRIYAGGRGLMHSVTGNVHQLALALPLHRQGVNPPFDFFTRHPTPHALRNELYVANPLCKQLAANNTFVFIVRQHSASTRNGISGMLRSGISSNASINGTDMSGHSRAESALSIMRPSSAMSMASVSASGSATSNGSSTTDASAAVHKPAKLAIQSPGGKILRMNRKVDGLSSSGGDDAWEHAGSTWETIIKVSERGVWRGLVLADRSARWCVFGEWECV